MTSTTTEESIEVLVGDDEAKCVAQWYADAPECGRPAEWIATVHNVACVMEVGHFCGACMQMLKLASIMSRCNKCHTRDLLRDIRRI